MNPKFTKFLDEHKDITLIGLAWAGFWRLYLVVIGIAFLFGCLSALAG
jgi:hypothetical protein